MGMIHTEKEIIGRIEIGDSRRKKVTKKKIKLIEQITYSYRTEICKYVQNLLYHLYNSKYSVPFYNFNFI